MPRSAIIWTRSRKLSLNVMYHLTHRMMISWSKCRPLNRSCAEVGSVIPAVIAGYRAFQQFAPEPIELGPFDLLAWQLLWVGGLFIGQRFQENTSLLPLPHLLRPLFLVSAIAFLFWRWSSITSGPDPVTHTWLFDKWHLGPLRLINFSVTAFVAATFLKYLNSCAAPLPPFLLIGRHMLPVFCSQICLSLLLIGRTESGLTIEPITSALVLVICRLLTAPLFAWFLEWRSGAKQLARPNFPGLGTTQHTIRA